MAGSGHAYNPFTPCPALSGHTLAVGFVLLVAEQVAPLLLPLVEWLGREGLQELLLRKGPWQPGERKVRSN